MRDELGNFITHVSWKNLNQDAKDKLLLCLLANLSVAVAGSSAMRLPKPPLQKGHLLLDGGETSSAREAAFYNAALMHARTQDDFHPIGNLHIATIVIPAIFAQAERLASSGEAFLDALAASYATSAGLSRQFSPVTTPRGLRSTSLYACMGAAVGVERLKGNDPLAIANTLGLATQTSFGTTQCWPDGSDEYQFHTANAASQALLCSDLTQAKVLSGKSALDGPYGFYSALMGLRPSFESIKNDFEPNAAIVETVLKRYPVSGICQPVVRLSEKLALQVKDQEIDKIVLEMNAFEMNYPGTLKEGPVFHSFSDKLMSARYCLSSVLSEGRFNFDAFFSSNYSKLIPIMARINVISASDLGTLSCRISIHLKNGKIIQDELKNGGAQLAINWSSIDEWARDLWMSGGRTPSSYSKTRDVILDLHNLQLSDLKKSLSLE
jgi:2-methylcitrate dehydratase PrpD